MFVEIPCIFIAVHMVQKKRRYIYISLDQNSGTLDTKLIYLIYTEVN